MTESAIRSKLRRNGYHLVKMKDGYGVPGYMIADHDRWIIFGDNQFLLPLEEIEGWISEIIDGR